MRLRLLLVLVLCTAFPAAAADAWLQQVEGLVTRDVDLLEAKLAIDATLGAERDAEVARRNVASWVAAVRARTPSEASKRMRVDTLLSTLYVAGPWNDHRPFAYDLDDPFARQPRNRWLSTYLDTRRGNCVTMPLLVVLIGQRLGLPFALARAPQHLLARFRDDDGHWHNIEATSGGYKRDDSYVRDTGISQRALDHGVYLQPLATRQAVATLAADLIAERSRQGDDDSALALAYKLMAIDPNDVALMVRIGSLYARIVEHRFHRRWPNPADVPVALHAEYRALNDANAAWFAKAELLGWTPASEGVDAAYLKSIEREKARRQGKGP